VTFKYVGDCLIEVDRMGRFDCIVCLLDGV
jgi:hypothetical protein